jgi:hypothetical protein
MVFIFSVGDVTTQPLRGRTNGLIHRPHLTEPKSSLVLANLGAVLVPSPPMTID